MDMSIISMNLKEENLKNQGNVNSFLDIIYCLCQSVSWRTLLTSARTEPPVKHIQHFIQHAKNKDWMKSWMHLTDYADSSNS